MVTLWFKIGGSGGSFIRSRRNRRFGWFGFRLGARVVTRRSRRFWNSRNEFLGALEIPSSKNGSSFRLGCSVSALVGGILIVSSSNKAASLSCPVTVEIGGISLSSPLNLGTLIRQGAGSSETEALHPVTLVRVHSLGKSSSDLGPLGKCGEIVLRNPSTSCW